MAMKLSVIFDGKNEKLKQATKESEAEMQRLKSTALRVTGVIAAAYSAGTSARALLDNQRMMDRWNAQMRVAAGGVEEARAKMGDLNDMADRTGTRIDELVLGFTRLSNLGLRPSEDALLSYMNTSQAMGKSLEQFIEAVADASVAEFERLKEFGIKAKNEGETIKFSFQGVTTEVKNSADAIQDYLISLGQNQFAGIVEEQSNQVEAALNRLNNQWIKTLQTVNEGGLGRAMKASIEAGTEALGEFTAFIEEEGDTIIDVGQAIAAVFAARVLGATTAATRGFILHQAAQARVIARYAAMNNISTITATRLVAVGTAARFASAGMAMLGGPVGVISLAAYALYEYSTSADNAIEPTKSLKQQVSELADDFERMTEAQRESARITLQARIDEIDELIRKNEQLKLTQSELEGASTEERQGFSQFIGLDPGALDDVGDSAVHSQARIDELRQEAENLKDKLEELKKPANDIKNIGDGAEEASKKFQKVTDKLAMQLVELSLSEEQWERYAILQEAGADLNEKQIESIDRLIGRIRELRQEKEAEEAAEKQRQQTINNLASLSGSLAPQNSEINQHAMNMGMLDKAAQDPSLLGNMYVNDGQGGFRQETEVEKLARINQMKEMEMQRHAEEMSRINGDMTVQIDALWSETFDRFAAGIGDAVATSMLEGNNFAETMQSLYKNVAKTIISSLIEIGVKRMLLAATEQKAAAVTSSTNIAAISATTAASTAATGVTTATQTAAAGTVAAAWAPAAIWASIGSFGQAAVIAGGAILAVKALGGFRSGGYTGNYGENEVAGVVHGKEFVFDAKSTAAIGVKSLERIMNSTRPEAFLGIAHNGIGRVPESHEGTWMLRKDEMVLNPTQRENFELLVDHIKQQNGQGAANASVASGGVTVEITNSYTFEGGAGGNREEVEQAVDAANERFKAELIDDFSSGGRIYQTLKARG
ncbi:tape measure protein [Idiomarina xiamenensis]|uniref:Tape measure protein N-terminal domain-containing protein n=1 Tax=Idiomarina xiamenensis 10-D-4 TaxID=740709 RepID=K2K9R4_9GAMM|nr:tape measure protein [Idiomarina xiamenensis]EKE79724.1 hypothetical protein A10D4_12729 [Idiomarina xiamenensis 10-D-4]